MQVLVFSTSTQNLNDIEALVRHLGFNYRRLDGESPQRERARFCKEFSQQASVRVFIMSTQVLTLAAQ